nr:hypothetical protein [Caldimonas sp.]
MSWWTDTVTFFTTLPPDFAFLLAMPFFVAAVAFAGDGWRSRRERRRAAGGREGRLGELIGR